MQTAASQTPQTVPFTVSSTEWDTCLRRVRAEFWEMPGLALSVAQAQRLWSLERAVVEKLFAELVAHGELRQRNDQRFVRARNDR
jgi:hypothetical protein